MNATPRFKIEPRSLQLAWFLVFGTFCLVCPGSHASDAGSSSVRLKDGRIQEYAKGSLRRTYGSNLVDVATDGVIVAGVTKDGRIAEYKNGSRVRTYGMNAIRVRVQQGTVFAELKSGRTAEYVNGSLRRTF
ncbi:MAG: IceA2 protein [Verrucomicrobiales bacterium]